MDPFMCCPYIKKSGESPTRREHDKREKGGAHEMGAEHRVGNFAHFHNISRSEVRLLSPWRYILQQASPSSRVTIPAGLSHVQASGVEPRPELRFQLR